MARKLVHTITKDDIGKTFIKYTKCRICGSTAVINTTDVMGRILSLDVGKRIYDIDGIYYVENQEQLEARLKRNKEDHND
jgi:hypothetical protein